MFIFVCSPLRSKTMLGRQANYLQTLQHCRDISDEGHVPLAPTLCFSQFLDRSVPQDRKKSMEAATELLRICDEVWVYSEDVTPGMAQELRIANLLDKKVVYKI